MLSTTRNNVNVCGNPDGEVVMFAHGFGCDQQMWRHVVDRFTAEHRVVLFDLVGAGQSDSDAYDPAKYSSIDGYAADIIEICDDLGVGDVVLVGHSVSAAISLRAAILRPDLFARLILVAPSPCYIDHPEDGYVGGFSADDIDGLLRSLDSNYFAWSATIAPMVMGLDNGPALGEELAGSFCQTDPDIASRFARVTFLTDVRPLLGQVRTPTLILQCSDDMLAPVGVGAYLNEHLAGSSTMVRLAATGHCPHVSAPQETAAAILHYLSSPG